MNKNNNGALKFLGIVMIIFGLLYALLGTLSLIRIITGVLPGHENQDAIIVTLSYIIAIIAIVGGVISIKRKLDKAKIIGIVFATIGLISLVYTQIIQNTFNNFDCITIVLGLGITILSIIAEKDKETIEKSKKAKHKKREKSK